MLVVTNGLSVYQFLCPSQPGGLCVAAGVPATLTYSGTEGADHLTVCAGPNASSACSADGALLLNSTVTTGCALQAACGATAPSIQATATQGAKGCAFSIFSVLASLVSMS